MSGRLARGGPFFLVERRFARSGPFHLSDQRFSRAMRVSARSSADRNAERSRGPKGGGPDVVSPAERRSVIRFRVASAEPMFCGVHSCPFGDKTRAPIFTHLSASGRSCVTTTVCGLARSAIPVVGDIGPGGHDHALDEIGARNLHEGIGDDEHARAAALRDLVDLVLHGDRRRRRREWRGRSRRSQAASKPRPAQRRSNRDECLRVLREHCEYHALHPELLQSSGRYPRPLQLKGMSPGQVVTTLRYDISDFDGFLKISFEMVIGDEEKPPCILAA